VTFITKVNATPKAGGGAIAKSVAKEKEWKWKDEIASGKYESRKKNMLFEKLVRQYLKYYKVNRRARSVGNHLNGTSYNHSGSLGRN